MSLAKNTEETNRTWNGETRIYDFSFFILLFHTIFIKKLFFLFLLYQDSRKGKKHFSVFVEKHSTKNFYRGERTLERLACSTTEIQIHTALNIFVLSKRKRKKKRKKLNEISCDKKKAWMKTRKTFSLGVSCDSLIFVVALEFVGMTSWKFWLLVGDLKRKKEIY